MIKKVLSAILICIFALPSYVFATYYNSEDIYGEKFPSVRDQKKFADCWSYAAIGAVEHSMVVNDNADFSDENKVFSEHHMSAAMNVTNDNHFENYTRSHNVGGNRESAVAYLARDFASGPVLYKDYSEAEYEMYLPKKQNYKMLTLEKKQATLTKALFLTDRDEGSSYVTYTIDEENNAVCTSYGKNESVINAVKNAVVKYGAVSVSYYAYERDKKTYFNPSTAAYCVPWEDYINKTTPDGNCVEFSPDGYSFLDASNHAVMIVGWDDNYSYENFKNTPFSFDGEKYTPENGAWIVKGSWGEGFGDNGYEYISYMEPTICQFATCYDMEYTAHYNSYTYTQKGLMGSVKFPDVGYGVCALNRFEGKEGLINAVGIYVCDENPAVQILIDTNCENEPKRFTKAQFERMRATLIDPETGEEASVIRFEKPGYYLLRLKEPIWAEDGFDLYVKYNVDEKSDVRLPTGNRLNTDDGYTEKVTYWAYITANNHVHEWKGIDVNWSVNAFTVASAFDLPKAEINDNKLTLKLYRYNENASGRVMAVFYKDGEAVFKESYTPQFDKYGYWEMTKIIEAPFDDVKAIVWNKNIVKELLHF